MARTELTIACPEGLMADANSLAMVLGEGPEDARTFAAAGWQGAGRRYAVISLAHAGRWIATASGVPATRPVWDTPPYRVNMAGAARAREALSLWLPGSDAPVPMALPDRIAALGGLPAQEALRLLGLVPVEEVPGGMSPVTVP